MSNDLQKINVSIDEANHFIKMSDCLRRLKDNPDYQALFVESIFDKELVRLSLLLGDSNLDKQRRKSTLKQIEAIAVMSDTLRSIESLGEMAKGAVLEAEAEAEIAAAEETA